MQAHPEKKGGVLGAAQPEKWGVLGADTTQKGRS